MRAWLIILLLLIASCAFAEVVKDCIPMGVYMEKPNGEVRQYFNCETPCKLPKGKINPVVQAKPMWTVQPNRYRGNVSIRKFNSGDNQ